nr:hypothetical protein Iba_chr15aCG8600 [Ipomoea batatas]
MQSSNCSPFANPGRESGTTGLGEQELLYMQRLSPLSPTTALCGTSAFEPFVLILSPQTFEISPIMLQSNHFPMHILRAQFQVLLQLHRDQDSQSISFGLPP